MRIVSGKARGARLFAPRGSVTRPTKQSLREALFSMLGSVEGCSVLDLYAGSGALGLEAWSRGAAPVVLVESARAAAAAAQRNMTHIKAVEDCRLITHPVGRALELLTAGGSTFELILVDPPYSMWPKALALLSTYLPKLLLPGGRLSFEGPRDAIPNLPLSLLTHKTYGQTTLFIYRAKENSANEDK